MKLPAEVIAQSQLKNETQIDGHLKILGVEFVYLLILGFIFAFFGWIAENTAKLFSSGIIDNRFHFLPFISCYALIPFAFHIVLGNANDLTIFGKHIFKHNTSMTKILSNVLSLIIIFSSVFLGELIVGNVWEDLFGVKLWDYSNQGYNLTQYTSLKSTIGYGLGAFLLFKIAFSPLLSLIKNKIKYKNAIIVCIVLGTLLFFDSFILFIQIVVFHRAPIYWTIKF